MLPWPRCVLTTTSGTPSSHVAMTRAAEAGGGGAAEVVPAPPTFERADGCCSGVRRMERGKWRENVPTVAV